MKTLFPMSPVLCITAFACLSGAAVAQSKSSTKEATVVQVLAGDLIEVQLPAAKGKDPEMLTVHLAEIDAPSENQPFAEEALEFTISLLPDGSTVDLTVLPARDDDRKDAVPQAIVVIKDKTDVAAELLREGLAWWAWQDSDRTNNDRSEMLAGLEQYAKLSRLGVFSVSNPVVPSNYRDGARTGGCRSISSVTIDGKQVDVLRSSDCVLIALMPNPRGTDDGQESITLANRSLEAISLDDWSISDDDGGHFELSGKIDAGQARTIVLDDQLQLGNNGDVLWLMNPQKRPVHAVKYSSSRSGQFVTVQ